AHELPGPHAGAARELQHVPERALPVDPAFEDGDVAVPLRLAFGRELVLVGAVPPPVVLGGAGPVVVDLLIQQRGVVRVGHRAFSTGSRTRRRPVWPTAAAQATRHSRPTPGGRRRSDP